MSETKVTKEGRTLTIVRVIKAPKDKVWQAYTDADIFAKWWGPNGWETTVKHMDFIPGGYLLYGMKCVDKDQGEWYGQTSWGKAGYDIIDPKDSFTYTDYFSDEDGKINQSLPATKVEMKFEEQGGQTKLTSISTFSSEEDLNKVLEMGMEEGIKQTIDRLADLLEG